jgi:hypothetical protein
MYRGQRASPALVGISEIFVWPGWRFVWRTSAARPAK